MRAFGRVLPARLSSWAGCLLAVTAFLLALLSAGEAEAQALPKISLQIEDATGGEMRRCRCRSSFC